MASMASKKRQHVVVESENEQFKIENEDLKFAELSVDDEDSSDAESSVYSGLGSSEDEDSNPESSEDEELSEVKENDNDGNTIRNVSKVDEYEFDSSDEEDIRNTVGNIPIEWYNDYPHIGYDWDGNKIMKPATKDELDKFLSRMEDSNYWRTVKDNMTGQDVILSDEHIDIIQRIQGCKYPDKNYNPFKDWVDTYSHEVEIHPLTNQPEHKRSFIPSKIEKEKVAKLLHAIKMGWILPGKLRKHKLKSKKLDNSFYMLWDENETNEISKRMAMHMPAPKSALPGHQESYNPPPEFLPEDRTKYSSLRQVPAYQYFTEERFNRCLDLYMCPRQRKTRLNIEPEDLIPQLPKAKDLHPFPTTLSIVYKGHTAAVCCLTVDYSGQYLASGSDDNTIKFWEIGTGRCLRSIDVSSPVKSIEWCPNVNVCIVAAAVGNCVVILNPGFADKLVVSNTDTALSNSQENGENSVEWQMAEDRDWVKGIRFTLDHSREVKQVTWHARGDYFASVVSTNDSNSVQVHQLTKRQSQKPFSKPKGIVQRVLFHPTKPYLFVATQKFIRIYNLLKQELEKKLSTTSDWISSMAIHPGGDNVITGSYDLKLSWFDLDLSTKPYKILRHHKGAIRSVAFHKRFPLFASTSDDCSLIVCHGKVFNDLLQNPLIVPVKILRGHKTTDDLGVLDCVFHPNSPWVFSSGADGRICLFT